MTDFIGAAGIGGHDSEIVGHGANSPSMALPCHLQTSFIPWHGKSVLLKPQPCSAPKIRSRVPQRDTTRELTNNSGARKGVLFQVTVPSKQMGAGDKSELVGRCGPRKQHEFLSTAPVSAAGWRTVVVKKLSQGRRHAGQLLELPVSQRPIHSGDKRSIIYTKHGFFAIDAAPLSMFNVMAGRT